MIVRKYEFVCIHSTKPSGDSTDASSSAVKYQMKLYGKNLKDGDVIITNSPRAGGSYVPPKFETLQMQLTFHSLPVTFQMSQSLRQCSTRNQERSYSSQPLGATTLTSAAYFPVRWQALYFSFSEFHIININLFSRPHPSTYSKKAQRS